MTNPILETIACAQNYSDLPETWQVPDIERFSGQKKLYDYQQDALKNAARALYLYYGKEYDWKPGEHPDVNRERKFAFAAQYGYLDNSLAGFSIRKHDGRAALQDGRINPIFRIFSQFISPEPERVHYHHISNRMCFWMATGSGKTLVMVKIIEYLRRLMDHGEIPRHKILILAPSNFLLEQIRKTVEEFNSTAGIEIQLVPLRERESPRQGALGSKVTVYYHRSDNLSDVEKKALTDYQQYEDGGKWYVLLDEAHKGGKEGSKRQAYYALMAREGFLFNFSATFTDAEDITTTVKKYNLQDFIGGGYGKNIYLNESEYRAFHKSSEEISGAQKREIVLKSLISLAFVSQRWREILTRSGCGRLYHRPLMLTLVNSVNTDIKNDKNDLWAFFSVLREIASGDIDKNLFKKSKEALLRDWGSSEMFFGTDSDALVDVDDASLMQMKIADLREHVFLSRDKSELQFIRGQDKKELAFQMKNADAPFALIRIGDTSQWRNEMLAGFGEFSTLKEKSFFDGLEARDSQITILMGSRSFFESWDSNRPNVINFINIGGTEAKKFVVQSVGRGVRIEPLPDCRRRLGFLWGSLGGKQHKMLGAIRHLVSPLETLFLFATNRKDVNSVMNGLGAERGETFQKLEGFVRSEKPKINGEQMPLFVPAYRAAEKNETHRPQFEMSTETLHRFRDYLQGTSTPLFVIRDGLTPRQINGLRGMVDQNDGGVKIRENKDYDILFYLQERVKNHVELTTQETDGVRPLNEDGEDGDIVHFREIRVALGDETNDLRKKIEQVARGGTSLEKEQELAGKFSRGEITKKEWESQVGEASAAYRGLKIEHIAQHYYVPLVIAEGEKVDFIQHIIKQPSEKQFIKTLEDWLSQGQSLDWDAWMFSKIDESLDKIHIPYYDGGVNDYRNFYPDFVFWMCKGNEYKIVFVDPKTTEYTSGLQKVDGYAKLFERDERIRKFSHGSRWKVAVHLKFFNSPAGAPKKYKKFWTDDIAEVFAP